MDIFNKKPFLIASIGNNVFDIAKKENISEIDAAKLMIYEAKRCGIDAVMLYSFKAENIIAQNVSFEIDWVSSSFDFQLDYFKNYDKFGYDDIRELKKYCDGIGIDFLVSPLDFESVDNLDEILSRYVISSSDITNMPFIEYIAKKNKPILLLTGGATMREVKDAVKLIEDVSVCDIAIFLGT